MENMEAFLNLFHFEGIKSGSRLAYILIVLASWVVSLLLARYWIYKVEKSRIRQLQNRKRFDAIPTQSPLDDPNEEAITRGLESIETRFNFIRRLIFPLLSLIFGFMIVLPFLSTAPAKYGSFFLGILTVIAGIAAKPLIENLISGLVISMGQPIRIGDTVNIDGHYGTVEEIALTYIVVKIWDWRRYIIPNHKLLQKEFINYSLIDRYQWAHVEFWVAPEAPIDKVREIALDAVRQSPAYVPYESPAFWIIKMDKEGINCWVAGWTDNSPKAWTLQNDIRFSLIKSLQEHNIRFHAYNYDVSDSQKMRPTTSSDPGVPGVPGPDSPPE